MLKKALCITTLTIKYKYKQNMRKKKYIKNINVTRELRALIIKVFESIKFDRNRYLKER